MAQAVLGFFTLELSRAVLTEGMYQSTNRVPILHPQLTIFIVECVRLAVAVAIILRTPNGKLSLSNLQYMAVQSMLWFINNCIYFATLRHASVATVSILMQLRLPITALIHHFFVRRQESQFVWAALAVIYLGVVLSLWTNTFSVNDASTVFLCLLLSTMSSVASIVSEKVMKTLEMPFWEQQVRVCFLGVVSSAVFLAGSSGAYVNYASMHPVSVGMTCGSILASAGAGLFTGIVVKKLDSVVKLIAQAIAAVSTTIAIWLVFGTFKAVVGCFVVGSLLLVSGTVVYGLEISTNPANE
ncbi:hypothetical protein HDU98_003197, partial [Podochytrium sp. JEL0797]